MRKSTINLTKKELLLAEDTNYLLSKQKLMGKLGDSLQQLADGWIEKHADLLVVSASHGRSKKLSKGENYRGLPYLVMDIPQISGPDFDLLFRVVFWWGHGLTLNLYLNTKIIEKIGVMGQTKTLIQTDNRFMWENDLTHKSFSKVKHLTETEWTSVLQQAGHIRLCKKVKLADYGKLEEKAKKWLEKIKKNIQLKQNQSGS